MNNFEEGLLKILKKYEKDEDNQRGIIRILKRNKDYDNSMFKMYEYLTDKTTSKARDSIIRKAYSIIGKEIKEGND